jgi:hypothetical protein
MSNPDLKASWSQTREYLSRARQALPRGAGPTVSSGSLGEYEHYLGHNELELALECLVEAAQESEAPSLAWVALADAADSMKLTERAEKLRRRAVVGDS